MPPALSERRKIGGPVSVVLEALDHPVALLLRHAAVQEEHLPAEGLLQVPLEDLAHLGELA